MMPMAPAVVKARNGTADPLSRRACCGALLGCVAMASAAQTIAPQPSAPRQPKLAAPLESTLANGLRVVVARRDPVPLASVRLVVLAGSETDPARRAGRAALTAALLGRGTRRYSAPALAAAAEALGGSLVSEAGRHQSSLAITVTTPMLGAAIALVAEVATRPAFRAAELTRLRSQLLDELKLAYASPATLAALAMQQLLFGGSAYGRAVDGTPTSLPRIARDELLAMHAAHYLPQDAALVLTGDVALADASALAERHFGDWANARSDEPGTAYRLPPAFAPSAPMAALDLGASGQAAIALGMRVPGRAASTQREAATAAVVNAVLGADYSSRLNQEIRIRRGLSYGAGSSLAAWPLAGMLLATVQARSETAAEIVELMHREIDRLIDTPVGADELAARKSGLIGRFARSVETTDGLAGQVVARLVNGVAPASLVEYGAALAAVDAADVQRYARDHFGRAGRRVVVAGDASRFGAQLEDFEPRLVRLRSHDLNLD